MSKKFCAVCGREGDFAPSYICPDCSETSEKKTKLPRGKICTTCSRVFVKGRWRSPIPVTGEKTLCPICYSIQRGGYKAVLRFSGEKFEKVKLVVENTLKNVLEKENKRGKKTAITKVEDSSYYLTHVSTARAVARKIREAFPVQVSEHAKLVGYDRAAGKGKYRVVVSVKLL